MINEKIRKVIGNLIDVDSGTYILTNKKVPLISSIIDNNKVLIESGINIGEYIPFENVFLKECVIEKTTFYLYYLTINPSNCEIIDYRERNYNKLYNKIFEMFYKYLIEVCNEDINILLFGTWFIEDYIKELEFNGFRNTHWQYINLINLDWEYTLISICPDENESFLFSSNKYIKNFSNNN